MDEIIKELKSLIEDCETCKNASWKECGCSQEGFNDGINKAILLIEGHVKGEKG